MIDEGALNRYRSMLTIRLFELKVKELYRRGEIPGAIHLYIGQEAIAVGICSTLRKTDYVASTHRGHGHLIAKGGDLKSMMAELMGKKTGCSSGFGGSMHMFDAKRGFLGGNGIVGGGIPIALGAAFSAKYRKSDQVAVTFFGDGAANQGTFHECLNLAALWKLPFIAVCENNGYAATTPTGKATSVSDVAARATGYGVPGIVVDGNDCEKVRAAAAEAVSNARKGHGPSLVECKTYRVEPHCGIIADTRPKGEREHWLSPDGDPILKARKKLEAIDETWTEGVRGEIERNVREAVEFARGSDAPSVDDMFKRFGDY